MQHWVTFWEMAYGRSARFINKILHNLKECTFKQYIDQYLHNPSKNLASC